VAYVSRLLFLNCCRRATRPGRVASSTTTKQIKKQFCHPERGRMPESKGPEGADRPMAMESIFTLMRHPLRENEGAPHKPVLLVWESGFGAPVRTGGDEVRSATAVDALQALGHGDASLPELHLQVPTFRCAKRGAPVFLIRYNVAQEKQSGPPAHGKSQEDRAGVSSDRFSCANRLAVIRPRYVCRTRYGLALGPRTHDLPFFRFPILLLSCARR